MKKVGIVTDSHSSVTQAQALEWGIRVIPMPFYIGGTCYYEDVTLSREEFFRRLAAGELVSTSQPSPELLFENWDAALQEYEKILYLPISSGLSGACMTAKGLAQEDRYAGRVLVVDNGRVSTPQIRSILDAMEMIAEGYEAEEIRAALEAAGDQMVIYIGVDTLKHLKDGGRITPATAALGTVLHIKPVLKLGTGALDVFRKCRGFAKARRTMIEAVEEDLRTVFREPYERGEVTLMAATSATPEETADWVREIGEAFPGQKVLSSNLSLGVSCHTGAGSLGIGLSVRPKRPGRKNG